MSSGPQQALGNALGEPAAAIPGSSRKALQMQTALIDEGRHAVCRMQSPGYCTQSIFSDSMLPVKPSFLISPGSLLLGAKLTVLSLKNFFS